MTISHTVWKLGLSVWPDRMRLMVPTGTPDKSDNCWFVSFLFSFNSFSWVESLILSPVILDFIKYERVFILLFIYVLDEICRIGYHEHSSRTGFRETAWSRKPPDSGADYLKQYTKLFLTL